MSVHKFKFGKYTCSVLHEGTISLPIYKEFDENKKEVVLQAFKADGNKDETAEISFNYLLLDDGTNKILIDTGKGSNQFKESLKSAGYFPEDINYVIITHADFDHVGGLGLFQKAKIILPRLSHQLWTDRAERKKLITEFYNALIRIFPDEQMQMANQFKENFGAVTLYQLRDRIQLVNEDEAFLPGISLFYTPGHRSDHYCVSIKSEGEHLIAVADAFRHPFQLKYPDLYSLYDSRPADWTNSIHKINNRNKDGNAMFFATHYKFPGIIV